MKKRTIILWGGIVLALAAFTSYWWGKPLLQFLNTRSDLVQAIEAALQILLWMAAALVFVFGWRVKEGQPAYPPAVVTRQSGSGALAQGERSTAAGQNGVAIGGDVNSQGDVLINSTKIVGPAPVSPDLLLLRYLQWLVDDCAPLRLKAIDQAVIKPGSQPLGLTSIYVDLNTDLRLPEKQSLAQHIEAASHAGLMQEKLEREQGEQKTRLVPVLEALGVHERLVVLGAPGSGKSTLTAFIALSLAQARLDQAGALDRLGSWWKSGPLLPVRVVLRQFAAWLPNDLDQGRAKHLWDFLETELERLGLARETAAALRQAAQQSGALFLLDGLDEARDEATRDRVLEAVAEFTRTAGQKCRFLLTSRPYAWQDFQSAPSGPAAPPRADYVAILAELPQAYRLAEFDLAQIQTFITHWYAAVRSAGWLGETDAKEKAANLQEAVKRSDLAALARNPLLLTLMATLHSNRTRLPDDRADLYNEVVELLLQRWNEKSGDDRGLLDALAIPSLKLSDLRDVMQQLAFEAHGRNVGQDGVADIAEGDLLAALRPLLANDTGKADLALDYIEKRAGLLLGQGERGRQRQYTFPHRTFQEYLAACYLAGRADFCQKASDLAHQNAAHWREVLTLAARHAKAGRGVPAADALVRCQPLEAWLKKHAPTEGDWRAAVVAGEQLLEIGLAAVESREEHRAVRERVAGWLVHAMERSTLPPADRAKAGGVLARLGDPRRGVGLTGQGVPDMDWIEIPAGPFLMGNNKPDAIYSQEEPQFSCTLIQKPYRISRYLVTVAQYQAFVEAKGYETERFWTKAGWKWKSDRSGPEAYEAVYQTANHPRVGVSWYEAIAFCRWLSEQLDLNVTLPSEAEWERGARHTDGRVYPWGNSSDDVPQRCNMVETGLGHTSPVGMFPNGHAVCGAADLAGNVWEWTRSLWGKTFHLEFRYPYRTDDGREDLDPAWHITRVLRGGAYNFVAYKVRCAYRGRDAPDFRDWNIGFRVVASPFVSGI